ncbi:MAG: phosphotransferase [Sciscionella sp.]
MVDTSVAVPARWRDLRKQPVDDVLSRVEAGLGVVLDRETVARKRRSVGARSARGTWVRVELRSLAKIAAQGQAGNGMEAANLLSGIAKPAWYAALCWHDAEGEAVWRADEIQLVTDTPLQRRALREVSLSQTWWATLNASLDALRRQHTTRIATPDTEPITQGLVTREIERAFPDQVDTTLTEPWVPAHADLNWANLTWPECWIIDWEDHGIAPRGLDAAKLWASSLGIGELAERVWQQRRADLETGPGRLMGLFCCAKILNDSSIPAEPRETTTHAARALVADLRQR